MCKIFIKTNLIDYRDNLDLVKNLFFSDFVPFSLLIKILRGGICANAPPQPRLKTPLYQTSVTFTSGVESKRGLL